MKSNWLPDGFSLLSTRLQSAVVMLALGRSVRCGSLQQLLAAALALANARVPTAIVQLLSRPGEP